MKKRAITQVLKYACILLLTTNAAFAGIRLPAIFGDNMVLQRNIRVPLFGFAEIGEKIEVEFMGSTYKAITGADGKWAVKLGSYKAGGPYEMRIGSKAFTLTLKNILIGDVWLASGQSNMEYGLQTDKHGADAISKATDNLIHFFYVPMALALQPQQDIAKTPSDSPNGKWVVCSPSIMADPKWAWHGFSAVGYYFAQQIRRSTNIPIGMIGSYRGGTPVQAWISLEGLQDSLAFTKYIDIHQKLVDNYATAKDTYPQRLTAYRDSLKIWNAEVGNDYTVTLKKWDADVLQAKTTGEMPPMRPQPSRPAPRAPEEPDGGYATPTICFNGVISPIVGYGLKGILWYQGETNGDRINDAVEYQDLFPRMIHDWRRLWKQGQLPFLFVQLPNYRAPAERPSEGIWPWVREGQQKTLTVPKTGMAVIIDAGEEKTVHPVDKSDPGNRLALIARHMVYGENVVCSGPVYKSMKVEGNKIILTFDEVNRGLVMGRPLPGATPDKELKGFGIATADQKFVWANAVIQGNTVVVSSNKVPNPVAVRYDWADNPPGNLYNKDGLPTAPFRTDNWPPPTLRVH